MSSNNANVIHEPGENKHYMHTYIECNNLLNTETEIDDACLTELGKAFHRVMTLGTNDENMYCVRANGLLKLVCWLVLYGKLCCTNTPGGK